MNRPGVYPELASERHITVVGLRLVPNMGSSFKGAPLPSATRDPRFYFLDGNVVLRVSDTLFKVSRIEAGKTPYDQDILEHAAEVFGCSPADLLSGPPGEKRDPESQLRSALLAFGVDAGELARAMKILKGYVDDLDESPERSRPDDQLEPANPRRGE